MLYANETQIDLWEIRKSHWLSFKVNNLRTWNFFFLSPFLITHLGPTLGASYSINLIDLDSTN